MEGEYEGIVDWVVDGDIIYFKILVFGMIKIRFVNVDIFEMYYIFKNEVDEN